MIHDRYYLSKDFRILGKDYLWMMSLLLIEELVKTRFQHSSSNIKPLFSTRIKQSSR